MVFRVVNFQSNEIMESPKGNPRKLALHLLNIGINPEQEFIDNDGIPIFTFSNDDFFEVQDEIRKNKGFI